MKRILLLFLMGVAAQAQAQFRLVIDQPASIAREVRAFGILANPIFWGINMDTVRQFSAPFHCIADSTVGCFPLTGIDLSGRIVIAKRPGPCEYATRVLNFQNAGAVGVVFYIPAGSLIMEPGSDALQVRIPVLGVQTDTMLAMMPAICGGLGTMGNAPTAVKARKAYSRLVISPQPAHDAFRIGGFEGEARVALLDGVGRSVQVFPMAKAGQSLRLSGLAPGLYTVRAHTRNGIIAATLIKE